MNSIKSSKSRIILAGVVVVAILIGFFVGIKVGSANNTNSPSSQFSVNGQGNRMGFRGAGTNQRGTGGGVVAGQILSKDADGVTIGLSVGGSKIVIVPQSANISKSVQGSVADLTVGEEITIQGATNGDGSVTAQSIQIRPVGSGRTASSSLNAQ